MLLAPIIHARTRNNDFPSGLLVVPDDFTSADAASARAYITQSTRYFELAENQGRRVVFCIKNAVVTGLSICIQDLYALCGREPQYEKVDGARTNFAFIGLVIPKSEIAAPFDVPYAIFLDQYETYMQNLWDHPYAEGGMPATKAAYRTVILPPAADVCSIPTLPHAKTKYVIDQSYAARDSICASVTMLAKESNAFGFCSDIPNASSVIESDFFIVTAKNAQIIIDALERDEKKKALQHEMHTERKLPRFDFDGFKTHRSSDVLRDISSKIRKTWKAIPGAVKIIGGFVIVVLASATNKKSD